MQYYKQRNFFISLIFTVGCNLLFLLSSIWITFITDVDGVHKFFIDANRNKTIATVDNQDTIYNYKFNHNLADLTLTFYDEEKNERSDLFYYLLGILILIISAFILRQRYKQYLDEKKKLNQ